MLKRLVVLLAVLVIGVALALSVGGFFDGDNGNHAAYTAHLAGWAWCGFDEAC